MHRTLTYKQEAFAREVAMGSTLADAYRATYSAKNMGMHSIRTEASRLMTNPVVSLCVDEKKAEIDRAMISSTVSDRERVLGALRAVMEGRLIVTSTQLKAIELLGKSAGVFRERPEGKLEVRSSAEIEIELEEKMASLIGREMEKLGSSVTG